MKKESLIISFPVNNARNIEKRFFNDRVNWLYLGKDQIKRYSFERTLSGRFKRLDIAKLNDQVAKDIRHEYIGWIDTMNRKYGRRIEWWFGTISSRNIYISALFQYCCYLEILEKLLKGSAVFPDLIIIESPFLAKAIKKWANNNRIKVNIINSYAFKYNPFRYYYASFCSWMYFLISLFLRFSAALLTRPKRKRKDLCREKSVIIDTFIHRDSMDEKGSFKDRYFPHLYEYLSKKGMNILVHPVLYGFRRNYFAVYDKMRQSNTHFIIPEDHLRITDYLSILLYPLRIMFSQRIEERSFKGYDLSDLIEEEKMRCFNTGMQAVLIYSLFLRLGKANIIPELIINWYENQVIDKALILGAHRASSKTRIVGSQLFIHSPNLLSLFPSQSEVEAKIVPDVLLETSAYQCQVLQLYAKGLHCQPAAAIRCSHLFDLKEGTVMNKGTGNATILILLSADIMEAIEIIEMVKAGMGEFRGNPRILIKDHPDNDINELKNIFGKANWPDSFEVHHGDLPSALGLASVVISSGTSSIVEALANGIPVIIPGRQSSININYVSDINMEIITECYSVPEMVSATNEYLDSIAVKSQEYKRMGKKMRDLFYTPVNDETMSPFLGVTDNG